MPPCIAALLHTVRVLLGYGRHLAETATQRSAGTDFNAIAVCFGTGRLYAILAHLQRGILRATALQNVLLARAARGRDIRFAAPRERAAAAPAAPTDPPAGQTADRRCRAEGNGAAVPPERLERSRTVHADIGGTRKASAPAPVWPHAGRYLPRPCGGARLLHRPVLERVVRQHPVAGRQYRHSDAGEDPPGEGVRARSRTGRWGAIGIGRRWDGTRCAACWGSASARRRTRCSIRYQNDMTWRRRPPARPEPGTQIEAKLAHGAGSWPAPALRFGLMPGARIIDVR